MSLIHRQKIASIYFLKGSCWNGENCPFFHKHKLRSEGMEEETRWKRPEERERGGTLIINTTNCNVFNNY